MTKTMLTTVPTTTTRMPSPNDCSMCGRMGFAILEIVLGLCSGAVFASQYHNLHAAVWCFFSAAVAAVMLYVHVTYLREHYVKKTSRLEVFMYAGAVITVFAIACVVIYIAVTLSEQQDFGLYGNHYVLAVWWSLLTAVWGFQLFYFSRSYWLQLTGEAQPLLPSEESPLDNKQRHSYTPLE